MNAQAPTQPVSVRRRTEDPGPRVLLHGPATDERVRERTLALLHQGNRGGVDALRRLGIRALALVSPFYLALGVPLTGGKAVAT